MSQSLDICLKRAYEDPATDDGLRYLVDRIWPRGVSKSDAELENWLKDIAPSNQLRKWFNHDRQRWAEFRRRYLSELKQHRDSLRELAEQACAKRITLVYGARDPEHNQAIVIREYLQMLMR